ncbi:MAG: hypothetical protein K2G87_00205 [Oscillospiraceae bacterium]|nr:hypothetical protein [Oscillospiraceae bacterium]
MFLQCPICGALAVGDICGKCGYAFPDEEELVAFYNFDPADYPQTSAVREIIPEHISAEIYPGAPYLRKPADVKVLGAAVQTAAKPQINPKPLSVPMKYNANMPAAGTQPVQNVQNARNMQNLQSPSEFIWDVCENFAENFRKCWTLLPLCYFFPPCILIYFVVAGVRIFSGERVSVPFGLLTALAAVLGSLGGIAFLFL